MECDPKSDWLSSHWEAGLRSTRTTPFRMALVVLMLVGLFRASPSSQFPSCTCATLDYLCTSLLNDSSCDAYDSYCQQTEYCACLTTYNNEEWCQQFCPTDVCECVACPASASIDTDVNGSEATLTAHAVGEGGTDYTSSGEWSWSQSNPAVGQLSYAGNVATFTGTAPGETLIEATFSKEGAASPSRRR